MRLPDPREPAMTTTRRTLIGGQPDLYETDIIAWAERQAALLRSGRFEELDIERIAAEIEDVGKSEERELARRMSALLMRLLEWQHRPGRRGAARRNAIVAQRQAIAVRLRRTPSLKDALHDTGWWQVVWADALAAASAETGLGDLPAGCPWTPEQVQDMAWLPASGTD